MTDIHIGKAIEFYIIGKYVNNGALQIMDIFLEKEKAQEHLREILSHISKTSFTLTNVDPDEAILKQEEPMIDVTITLRVEATTLFDCLSHLLNKSNRRTLLDYIS